MVVKNLLAGKKNFFASWQRPFLSILVITVGITAVMLLLYELLPPSQPAYAQAQIDPALQEILAESESGELIRFIVHLRQKADINRLSLPADELARRTLIVETLQQTAVTSQASLLPELERLQADGLLSGYRPLWIINAIAAQGTVAVIEALSNRPEIERITLDASFPLIQPPEITDDISLFDFKVTAAPTSTRSWGIDRIGAPHVWHGLGIDGSGVTVAIMDSGVNWLHPDLLPNYRGNLGNGNYQHAGNWYFAFDPTAMSEPVDFVGHGTHVAGTAVGQNGIGVAPGAKWIAVSISDENGFIQISAVHAAFAWLLAPNGNPALAPDIVNGSWGRFPDNGLFLEDIDLLFAAGILPIFSAGNTGPSAQTVWAPASYTNTFAIGASDQRNELAWFSSRGPSTFTTQERPNVVAPGTQILSSYFEGGYAIAHGTSMAAPHATGAAALLLAANPSLLASDVKQALLATAVPMSTTQPNNNSGWGRIDVYAAVASQVESGIIRGTVQGNGQLLAGLVMTVTAGNNGRFAVTTDTNGQYEIPLQPGSYELTLAPFGFQPKTITGLTIQQINDILIYNITLNPLPAGIVTGIVRTNTGEPLTATITVPGTPVTADTDADGRYTLSLPINQYKLQAHANGRRLGQATILPIVNQTIVQNFSLTPGPSILLVDSGQWYYGSEIAYYEEALTALGYTYGRWPIYNPFSDAPKMNDLQSYDTLIWASPLDSPGTVFANTTITQYLKIGGNFFVSGQEVGSTDGFGFGNQTWWYRDLQAEYKGWQSPQPITGAVDTLFAGLTIHLNGGDSAQNQISPDYSLPQTGALTDPIFLYGNGLAGGLQTSQCKPFRVVYLGFGLEGVSDGADRAAIIDRTMAYFAQPPVEQGIRWKANDIDDYALLGQQLVYTVSVQNLSESLTDTFDFQLSGQTWAASVITPSVTLGPCEVGTTVLQLTVPSNLPRDTVHSMVMTAVARNNPTTSAPLNLRHKIPGHILFVDDDRWYDNEGILMATLDAMNLSYDVWETGWRGTTAQRGSPSAEFLQYYDFIIWYTGYDWYRPITNDENQALYEYMEQGGRLFLTSQDYLDYHWRQPLAQNYLGFLTYRESITPTQVYAGFDTLLPSELAGPVPLHYKPYQNFSDGVLPASGAHPILWGDQGYAAGLANAGQTAANKDWRVVFWSFPFETMTTTAYAPAMNSIMGWLSDLGDSTFAVDQRVGAAGATRKYTITVQNVASGASNHVWLTNTLPVSLTLSPSSILGGAAYDIVAHQLRWDGVLAGGETHVIRYEATAVAAE
jgi:uncharacterized repeat protein (TIGR01451 family)